MKRAVLGRWLGTVSLSLWLGGLIAIGAIVAPVTAHFIAMHPAFAADPIRKQLLLTAIVGGSLRVFNDVCYGCAALLLLAQALLWRDTSRRVAIMSLVVTLTLLASALTLGLGFFPAMDAAQAAGRMAAFDRLHKTYEAVSTNMQFPLLLILVFLAAARDTFRPAEPSILQK